MPIQVQNKDVRLAGKLFRTARLRHEWCDFLDSPMAIEQCLEDEGIEADIFTFVDEVGTNDAPLDFHHEQTELAVLKVTTHAEWWANIGFKPRNKIRKGQKSGIELKPAALDIRFSEGVEKIYNESPIRQGRKFYHYGKRAAEIHEELKSFENRSILIGAYLNDELVGFMKLYNGNNILRTIHIISSLNQRDKCVMDVLIDKAVQLCEQQGASFLNYGSWTDGGVGVFRSKHGFEPMSTYRYFVPITWRGQIMLTLELHRPLRDKIPTAATDFLRDLRTRFLKLTNGIQKVPSTSD